jgi:hypothetical protein
MILQELDDFIGASGNGERGLQDHGGEEAAVWSNWGIAPKVRVLSVRLKGVFVAHTGQTNRLRTGKLKELGTKTCPGANGGENPPMCVGAILSCQKEMSDKLEGMHRSMEGVSRGSV